MKYLIVLITLVLISAYLCEKYPLHKFTIYYYVALPLHVLIFFVAIILAVNKINKNE